mgnify:CR=1 FL=1
MKPEIYYQIAAAVPVILLLWKWLRDVRLKIEKKVENAAFVRIEIERLKYDIENLKNDVAQIKERLCQK